MLMRARPTRAGLNGKATTEGNDVDLASFNALNLDRVTQPIAAYLADVGVEVEAKVQSLGSMTRQAWIV